MIDNEVLPECVEELLGYLMDKEDCRKKELEQLYDKYSRLKDINYALFLCRKYMENKRKRNKINEEAPVYL